MVLELVQFKQNYLNAQLLFSNMDKLKMKLAPQFRLAEEFLNLKTINTNVIIEQLEQNIAARELSLESFLKRKLNLKQ